MAPEVPYPMHFGFHFLPYTATLGSANQLLISLGSLHLCGSHPCTVSAFLFCYVHCYFFLTHLPMYILGMLSIDSLCPLNACNCQIWQSLCITNCNYMHHHLSCHQAYIKPACHVQSLLCSNMISLSSLCSMTILYIMPHVNLCTLTCAHFRKSSNMIPQHLHLHCC